MFKLRTKGTIIDLIAISILIVCFSFLFWKAKYGYFLNDEPFMISLGHRLLKGDKLFVNEYNPAQMIGIVYAPLIWVFETITKSTDGLVLFIRYAYVLWWIFTSAILYLRLRQYGWISVFAVLFYALFTPLDEMSLTYNVMALSCIVLFSTYFLVEGSRVKDYLTGIVLSVAVVAYPYMVVLYLIWAISVLIANTVFKNRISNLYRIFNAKKFLRVTVTCAVCATLLLGFIFSAGVRSVVLSLKKILDGNSSMNITATMQGLFNLVISLEKYLKFSLIFALVLFFISLIDLNRYKRRLLYFLLHTLIWTCSFHLIFKNHYWDFNLIMLPISFLGIQAFILTKKKNWLLFLSLGITGIVYSYIAYISSDTGLMALSTGSVPLGISAWIFIYDFYNEFDLKIKIIKPVLLFVICCILAIQFSGQIYLKVQRNYYDEKTNNLNATISMGVAKGIITTDGNRMIYEIRYSDIQKIKEITSGKKDLNFLSLSLFPSIYLDLDYKYGTFSSWTYYQNKINFPKMNERLKQYYSDCKDKVPDCIYVINEDVELLQLLDFTDFSEYIEYNLNSGILFVKQKYS